MAEASRAVSRDLSHRCVAVARDIERMVRDAQRSELAQLRRLGRPGHPVPGAAFWELAARHDVQPREEWFWTLVVPLMARVPHSERTPGAAFHAAGVSAPRLERWLRRDADSARDDARLLVDRVDGGLDWGRLGPLLRLWTEPQRRAVARDFFRALRGPSRSAEPSSTPTPSDS